MIYLTDIQDFEINSSFPVEVPLAYQVGRIRLVLRAVPFLPSAVLKQDGNTKAGSVTLLQSLSILQLLIPAPNAHTCMG